MIADYLPPKPWLDLYRTDFVTLRILQEEQLKQPIQEHPKPDETEDDQSPPEPTPTPPLQQLPSEVLHSIFSRLEPENLSTAAQVCTKWLAHAYEPHHWRRIAQRTWPKDAPAELEHQLYAYKTWRKLATLRPRLRTNAIYITRHQFAKTASRAATTEPLAPVFLVTYHRFLRFYSDGTVVALTTPEPPDVAYRRVRRSWTPSPHERDKAHPSIGTYELDEQTLSVRLTLPMTQPRFPNMRQGTMFMHFSLGGTVPGACNRLFLTEHYAIMDTNGGDLVNYNAEEYGGKPFRLLQLHGFRKRVYDEFPRDDHHDLAQWYALREARTARRRERGQGAGTGI